MHFITKNLHHIIFAFILTVAAFGTIALLNSQDTINTEAQNRAGIKEGPGCYCDFITGWCEGLKVYNNQSSC